MHPFLRHTFSAFAAFTLVVLGGVSVFSGIWALGNRPNMPVFYQGHLTDSTYLPITDIARPMIFSIWNDESLGVCEWATGPADGVTNCSVPDAINIEVSGGKFTAPLGADSTNSPEITQDFSGGTHWLEIQVWNGSSYETLTPRRQLGGVLYAYNAYFAYDAGTVGGQSFAGISGGQTLYGGTDASDSLTLSSTSDSTKGSVIVDGDIFEVTGAGFTVSPTSLAYTGSILSLNSVDYTWPSTSTQGFLYNDGTDTLSWEDVSGVHSDTLGNTWAGTDVLTTTPIGNARYSTAFGYEALKNMQPGDPYDSHNTAIGYHAMHNTTTGWWNTAVGSFALHNNTTGLQNLAIGKETMGTNTTGSGNVAVGNSALGGGTGNQNVAVGVNAATYTSTGSSNVAIGYEALRSNTAGSYNVAVGNIAMYTATGTGNVTVGAQAGSGGNAGNYNTGVGYAVNAIGGTQNVGMGYNSFGSAQITGGYNVGIGAFSLVNTTTGNYNVTLGTNALYSNTVGWGNIAIGYDAGRGTAADHATQVDNYMTFIGFRASRDASIPQATILSKSVAIGYNAKVAGDNMMVLGGTGADAVNVGIGTITPTARLQVVDGDVYTSTAGMGMIVKSPDGLTCRRLGIDNSGSLTVDPVACP